MQTIKVELIGNNALKALQDLEDKQLIRIMEDSDLNEYALPGENISEEDFKKWISYAEESPTVSITEAKKQWAAKKKRLQNLIR